MDTMIFRSWTVNVGMEVKKLIVEKKDDETGEPKKILMRRIKKIVQLVHSSGFTIVFSSSMYQGKPRFKDSREPKKSLVTITPCVNELVRMLGVDPSIAHGWLMPTTIIAPVEKVEPLIAA